MTTFTLKDYVENKISDVTVNVEPIPFAGWINTSPPHIVDSGASVMKDEPVAYINVEERKLEWAKPTTWHTPTIAKMNNIPLYAHPAKTLTDKEITAIWYEPTLRYDPVAFAKAILKKASEK